MSKQTGNDPSKSKLTTGDFTDHPEVLNCLNELEAQFHSENPFIVSDVIDTHGNQYVNLVQKGGGVLGVALVGYTYILEKMNIRFLRLAGTSAGAINTALMTVIGKKEDPKSLPILSAMCELNFFDLVDGHPTAKKIIKTFITHHDFNAKVKKWLTRIVVVAIILLTGNFVFLGFEKMVPSFSMVTIGFFVLTGFYFLLIALLVAYSIRLLKRLKNSGFGINPGDFFYDWIKAQMNSHGVHTVSDLNLKASTLPELNLRENNPESAATLKGDVTFIASELVTQNKIQFPEMCYLFRTKDQIDTLEPAGFIRASMSIPVFFESYMINDIPCENEEIKKAWMDTMNELYPPSTARFVDGGMLSNFPINIFYNPKVITPRLPSFGIDLDDSTPEDDTKNASSWTLLGYFGRMFNTIRYYYDKDFLLKNKVYEKGIGKVPLSDFNWLNFFLSDQDKINMFVRGARAATDFLKGFDWDSYKNNRIEMQITINEESGIENQSMPKL